MSSRISGQAFAQSYVELHKVRAVQFGLLDPDEVRKMSVCEIKQERIYTENGSPNFNAINDPRMGTMDKTMKSQADCPGHFGYISLALPVYHAGLLEYIRRVLRTICFNCSKVLAPRDKEKRDEIMKIRNHKTRFNKVFRMSDGIKKCEGEVDGCGQIQPKYTKEGLRLIIEHMDDNYDASRDRKQVLQADETGRILERISNEDCELMGFKPKISRPECMIIKNLAVAPPPVRPSVAMTNTLRSEDDLTFSYQKIIQFNNQLQQQMSKGAHTTTQNEIRQSLQYYVATLMDNEIQGQPTHKHKSGKALKAIRSRLRGKEGRLRGNLMGKRVDFSARTVIGPDPILQLDQLGVPIPIAMNLTVPETVTPENIDEMRKLVSVGPNGWPGAKYIIRHDDKQIELQSMKNRSDAHLEPGYRVERHLRDNDYVIFNRQPSLHKMSLMGHRVKVLPFLTFRLNLSATTPYNADFDGDEMNMHVPQSYETMAEIKEIMSVPNQIVSPQSNKPVMGIVQDALLGIMLFTLKDNFLEIDTVMQLLMWINYNGSLPPPAVIKPKLLWTGKQIFSLIVPNINVMKMTTKQEDWVHYQDKNIYISKGELHCGLITKGIIGNTPGGMIHIIWKDHGPYATRDFVSNTQLLINNWLFLNGFTVGVQDIIARPEIIDKIKNILQKCVRNAQKILQDAQMGKLKSQPGKSMMESYEASVNQNLNQARDQAGDLALEDLQSWNRLKAMVQAGSKGSKLNISQIMSCVGQQNVEGKRIPFGFHKRTLPHFSKDDYGPESKGFVENCYLGGLTPQEFFFHAMGGREGLIDTAVKTAETGYIQRRLIKALEDVMVKYDGTVRTSMEQVIQFLYGEDGFAGEHIEDLKIESLTMDNQKLEQNFKFLPSHMSNVDLELMLSQSMPMEVARQILIQTNIQMELDNEFKQIQSDREILRHEILTNCDDEIHIQVNVPRLIWNAKQQFGIMEHSISDLTPSYVLEQNQTLMDSLKVVYGLIAGDELLMEAHKNSTWLFKIYLKQQLCTKRIIQQHRLTQQAYDYLLGEIKSRFDQGIVNPGEMVGSIGAQSMGEPATQMTLNTFHQAGVSSKNVTLGVPRLKEIINVAKNIKTPSMKIYLEPKQRKKEKAATKLGGKIEHTTLSHIVKNTSIYYDPDPHKTLIKEDEELLELYSEIPNIENQTLKKTPWVLRLELDNEKMHFKDLSMGHIERKLFENFGDQINIMHSDDNAEKLILRLRIYDIEDDDEETVCMYLKEFEDKIMNEVSLKGIHEIEKVTFTKYNENEFDEVTGGIKMTNDNWLIETDGVALQKILGLEKVDKKRTISNDIIEILRVLGIEAVRKSLINELRLVLGTYGIYVNYRHLSTLCDIMTSRGILTAITRHGINRVETGALRKCSFEETVEILLEAAVFAETDHLKGITENLIMGQLAPFGTGSFDLVIDPDVLKENAQVKPQEQFSEGGNTPLEQDMGQGFMTPNIGQTPHPGQTGAYSTYSMANTPHYDGGFTPGPGVGSPMYSPNPFQTPNPGMQTPGYAQVQSPIYQAYQSPIYRPAEAGRGQSPGPTSSPNYSPTGTARSPAYNIGYSPSYNYSSAGAGNSLQNSGGYSNQSPGYSPSQGAGTSGANYSPTGVNPSNSPAYSPTTPNYNNFSPSYSPTTPGYGGSSSPRYQVQSSPRYSVNSGNSGNNSSGGSPAPAYNLGSMYIPTSPAYNPTSPAYQPTAGYVPQRGRSPIQDSDDEEKKE